MRKTLRFVAVGLVAVGLVAAASALAFVGPVAAQDFVLPYNKTPETAPEFWAAAKHELMLGNHKRAGEMLQKFAERLANLGAEDQNKLLLAIHDRDGLSTLLRLANLESVKALKANDPGSGKEIPLPDVLIKKMSQAVDSRHGDAGRIEFFVSNLGKSPEERAYAMLQLKLAGPRAVPALLKALGDRTREKDHRNIVAALARMDSDFAPAALAGFDAPSDYIRSALIRVFEQRGDKRVVPYLWWLSGSPNISAALKAQANVALARFLGGSPEQLKDARSKLTEEANRWYRKQGEAPQAASNLWAWDNSAGTVVATPATKTAFEDYQAMYWAKKALEVDPSFVPAQTLLVSAAIDRALAQHGLEQSLGKADPATAMLLAAAGAPLLDAVLERALAEGRSNVALGAARAIGEAGDPRSLRPDHGGLSPLAKALSYGDPRVQFAAAAAVLAIPVKEPAPGTSRVVEALARTLGATGGRKALVGHGKSEEAQRLAGLFKQAGFEAQAFTNGRQLLQAASEEGGLAAIAVHANLPDPGLAFLLSQLAADANSRSAALLVFADDEAAAREISRRYPKLKVVSPIPATADLLKAELDATHQDAGSPALTDAERKAMAAKALEFLAELAKGAGPRYHLEAADGPLMQALASDELAAGAAKVLAYRPGRAVQSALAETALRDVRTPAVRAAAVAGLRSNFERFGVTLSPEQLRTLAKIGAGAADTVLREQADRLAAFLQPSPEAEGERLLKFPIQGAPKADAKAPANSDAPPAKDEEKKEEKKEGA